MAYWKEETSIELVREAYGTFMVPPKWSKRWIDTSRSSQPTSRKSATHIEAFQILVTPYGSEAIQPDRWIFATAEGRN